MISELAPLSVIAFLSIIGATAGFLSGLLGIGGGLIVVPALGALFSSNGVNSEVVLLATATSLMIMCVTTFRGAYTHLKLGHIDFSFIKYPILGMVVGGVIGRRFASFLDDKLLTYIFLAVVCVVIIKMLFFDKHNTDSLQSYALHNKYTLTSVCIVMATIGSMIGISSGTFLVPWLLSHRVPAKTAVATSAVCGFTLAIASSIWNLFSWIFLPSIDNIEQSNIFVFFGPVSILAFLIVSFFSYVTVPAGVALTRKIDQSIFKKIFAAFLMSLAIYMYFKVTH